MGTVDNVVTGMIGLVIIGFFSVIIGVVVGILTNIIAGAIAMIVALVLMAIILWSAVNKD